MRRRNGRREFRHGRWRVGDDSAAWHPRHNGCHLEQRFRLDQGRAESGYDGRYFSVDFTRTDHAAVAAAYGIKTWTIREPGDLEQALKEAVEADEPTLVDVITQPLQEAKAPVSEWVA